MVSIHMMIKHLIRTPRENASREAPKQLIVGQSSRLTNSSKIEEGVLAAYPPEIS